MTGNDQNLLDPACQDLFDDILDRRLIDDRQHFLRHRLCLRQETRTETGCRNHSLTNFIHGSLLILLSIQITRSIEIPYCLSKILLFHKITAMMVVTSVSVQSTAKAVPSAPFHEISG